MFGAEVAGNGAGSVMDDEVETVAKPGIGGALDGRLECLAASSASTSHGRAPNPPAFG